MALTSRRLLRGCGLALAAALLCAVVTGLIIGNSLIGALERLTTAPPVTALPFHQALSGIHTLRANVRLQDSTGATLLAGEAIFAAQPPPADLYITWRGAGGETTLLYVNGGWYRLDGSAAESVPPMLRAFESAQSLDDVLRAIGLMLREDMAGWTLRDTTTDSGRQVEIYTRPLADLAPWDAWLGAESGEAEITQGIRDHLPYQIRYTLRQGDELLTLTIALSSFNDPLVIASPERK